MTNIHLLFGRAYGSEHDTCHRYQEHFSDIPDRKTFSTTDKRLRENNTINVQMNMGVHKHHSTSQLYKFRHKHKNRPHEGDPQDTVLQKSPIQLLYSYKLK
jgi:predicted transglutaminase-like cysteine proteinase